MRGAREREELAAKLEKKGRKKNLALLSFGEEAETEELELQMEGEGVKIRSAHDIIDDARSRLFPSLPALARGTGSSPCIVGVYDSQTVLYVRLRRRTLFKIAAVAGWGGEPRWKK